jgi:hypothetical protein
MEIETLVDHHRPAPPDAASKLKSLHSLAGAPAFFPSWFQFHP